MVDAFIHLLTNCATVIGAFTLRAYQLAAVRRVAELAADGARSILVQAPTGAGKTTIAAALITCARDAGMSVLFVAHRRELINQAYDRLCAAGMDPKLIGVIMASDPRWRPGLPIQVASIDTLRSRRLPKADLVVIDECHRALSPSFKSLLEQYPVAVKIGLTATPFRADGRPLGDVFSHMVQVATVKQLMDEGSLVNLRCFTVPPDQMPDLSQVQVRRGDYDERELGEAMNRSSLIGNIVEHWAKLANGVRTVVFATNIAHSQHILARFLAAGVFTEHLDGTMPNEERDRVLARLECGRTRVISSVMCLAEGWDQPSVKCAILARPTKSLGLYMQQAGRILRPHEGLSAILLDHAGCVLEHGLPQEDREYSLAPKPKRKKGRDVGAPPVRACTQCYAVVALQTRVCPECGFVFAPPRQQLSEEVGELVEVDEKSPALRSAEWKRLCGVARRQGLHPLWCKHRYREKFGEDPGPEFELPRWRPKTAEQKRNYFQFLLHDEPNRIWAAARYRAEIGEPAPV